MHFLDVAKVICPLHEVPEGGCRGFTLGGGGRPLDGLLVNVNGQIRGYINRCPHAGNRLNMLPHRFLSPDNSVIVCASHGALFEKGNGYCVAGPCVGRSLTPVALRIESGYVLIEDGVSDDEAADAQSPGFEEIDAVEGPGS
jgi:nitrite reductase/ring-hydroxylating ferredoxin subunit